MPICFAVFFKIMSFFKHNIFLGGNTIIFYVQCFWLRLGQPMRLLGCIALLKNAWVQLLSEFIFVSTGSDIIVFNDKFFRISWFYKAGFALLKSDVVYNFRGIDTKTLNNKKSYAINFLKINVFQKMLVNLLSKQFNFVVTTRNIKACYSSKHVMSFQIAGIFNVNCLFRVKTAFIFHYDAILWLEIEKLLLAGLLKKIKNMFQLGCYCCNALAFFIFNFYCNILNIYIMRSADKNFTHKKITYIFKNRNLKFLAFKISKHSKIISFYRFQKSFILIANNFNFYYQKINFFIDKILHMQLIFLRVFKNTRQFFFAGLWLTWDLSVSKNSQPKIVSEFNKVDVLLSNCANAAFRFDILDFVKQIDSSKKRVGFWKNLISQVICRINYYNKYFINWKILLNKIFNKKIILMLGFFESILFPVFNVISYGILIVRQIKLLRDCLVKNILQINAYHTLNLKINQTCEKFILQFKMPIINIYFALEIKGFRFYDRATANVFLLAYSEILIIYTYSCVILGFSAFYCGHFTFEMKQMLYDLKNSCFYTLRLKNKKSMSWCKNMYGNKIKLKISFKGNVFQLPPVSNHNSWKLDFFLKNSHLKIINQTYSFFKINSDGLASLTAFNMTHGFVK